MSFYFHVVLQYLNICLGINITLIFKSSSVDEIEPK